VTDGGTGELCIREFVPLRNYTTLGVGGPARYFVCVTAVDQLPAALDEALRRSLPVLILGGGSNLVVSDRGFPGFVVQIGLRGIETSGPGLVTAAAGEEWDRLVAWSVERGLAGIENLSGIPGSVGGTPIQNVGAYGQEVSETIESVRAFDRSAGCIRDVPARDCGFGYRASRFNTADRDRFVVLGVTFQLREDGRVNITYPDLASRFPAGTMPCVDEVRRAVMEIRAAKAMLLDPAVPDSRSAGSFFRNPVLSLESFAELENRAASTGRLEPGEVIPRYPADGGRLKVPAAWLIERAGFRKGQRQGRVGISNRHTLALVNLGGATSDEIIAMMKQIQTGVELIFGLRLQPEPVFVGF